MTPVRTAPGMEVIQLDTFLGMAPDQLGTEAKQNQLSRLENCYTDLRVIKKRLGIAKWQSSSHSGGSRTYGAIQHDASPVFIDFSTVKHVDNRLYFYNIPNSTYIRMTGATVPSVESWFAEFPMLKSGASADVSTTTTSGSTTSEIKLSISSLTPNAHVGKMVQVRHATGTPYRYEHKIIVGNTTSSIFVSSIEPLNEIPASGITVNIYPIRVELLFVAQIDATDAALYKLDATAAAAGISGTDSAAGMTRLDNSVNSYGYGFRGIETHANRVWGWKDNRVRWSDLGNGEQFSKNNYLDFNTSIRRIKAFTDDIVIIYERDRISALRTSDPNPANWELKTILPSEGCNFSRCVANYYSANYSLQFFVSTFGEVKAIPSDIFTDRSREAKVFSVSKNFIESDLSNAFACMEMTKEGHLVLGMTNSIWWRLNVEASERMAFKSWIWSKDVRATSPTNFTSNYLFRIGSLLLSGSSGSGVLYAFDVPGVYSDDGASFSMVIDKRSLQDSLFGDLCHFYTMNIAQGPSGGSTTMFAYFVPDNTPNGSLGSSVASWNPSTGDKHREIRIPASPSDNKSRGKRLDFRLTEDGSVQVADIERIEISFYPGTYK